MNNVSTDTNNVAILQSESHFFNQQLIIRFINISEQISILIFDVLVIYSTHLFIVELVDTVVCPDYRADQFVCQRLYLLKLLRLELIHPQKLRRILNINTVEDQ